MDSENQDVGEFMVKFDPGQAAGGQRVIGGETLIAWEPSSSSVAVKVTVMFQGTMIGMKTLNSTDLVMNYNGTSGDDYTKGTIKARFEASGQNGQLDSQGKLTWQVSGSEGSFTGFIGAWSVSS
jgi:hypothetical protein